MIGNLKTCSERKYHILFYAMYLKYEGHFKVIVIDSFIILLKRTNFSDKRGFTLSCLRVVTLVRLIIYKFSGAEYRPICHTADFNHYCRSNERFIVHDSI